MEYKYFSSVYFVASLFIIPGKWIFENFRQLADVCKHVCIKSYSNESKQWLIIL